MIQPSTFDLGNVSGTDMILTPDYLSYAAIGLKEEGHINQLSSNMIIVSGKFIGKKAQEQHRHLLYKAKMHLKSQDDLTICFNYHSMDTTVIVYIFKIIRFFNQAYKNNKKVSITWQFDYDDDMIDMGLDLSSFCHFDFNISNDDCLTALSSYSYCQS